MPNPNLSLAIEKFGFTIRGRTAANSSTVIASKDTVWHAYSLKWLGHHISSEKGRQCPTVEGSTAFCFLALADTAKEMWTEAGANCKPPVFSFFLIYLYTMRTHDSYV